LRMWFSRSTGQRTYANISIEAALTIRMVFHLALRQTEGFLRSLAKMGVVAWLSSEPCNNASAGQLFATRRALRIGDLSNLHRGEARGCEQATRTPPPPR